MIKISKELAEKIYDVLEEIGAHPNMRDNFVYHETEKDGCSEYRFQGELGFGGKFWNNGYLYVNCYSENETPKIRKMIDETNKKLWALMEDYDIPWPWYINKP